MGSLKKIKDKKTPTRQKKIKISRIEKGKTKKREDSEDEK